MIQLLREWAPGYGGVERTAHNLAMACGGSIASLRGPSGEEEPLEVDYRRWQLPSLPIGRFLLVLPSAPLWRLLWSRQPLLAHLPCPSVLALACLARVLRPHREVRFYWHAFLEPRSGFVGCLELLYVSIALRLLRASSVITTSPILRDALIHAGVAVKPIAVLPCALPAALECALLKQRDTRSRVPRGRLIFIGRLDSYKRVDWLLEAFAATPSACELAVVGDGPDRGRLEQQVLRLLRTDQRVDFHGRVSEGRKRELLSQADLLVLPADRCNEAFGIVQLEAMASGIPALAFDRPRSGMHWVSALPALPWQGEPDRLAPVLERVLSDPSLYRELCQQAAERYDRAFAHAVWQQKLIRILEAGSGSARFRSNLSQS